jgi:hypothetical protein
MSTLIFFPHQLQCQEKKDLTNTCTIVVNVATEMDVNDDIVYQFVGYKQYVESGRILQSGWPPVLKVYHFSLVVVKLMLAAMDGILYTLMPKLQVI